jgi:transposase
MASHEYDFYVGIDWATEAHQVTVVDPKGQIRAERSVDHNGAAITRFIDWLLEFTGNASSIAVAIEVPRGALVEMLVDRGIAVFSINPKQLDRFRDRHTVAGAKDDRLDAYVLGDSLRTDMHLFRRVQLEDPLIVQLREFSRMEEDLKQEKVRLTNRLREQVYRFFPQMLRLCPAADEPWFWDLIDLIPTPAHARAARPQRVTKLLRAHRIRRLSAEDVLTEVRATPVQVAPGTSEAARAHILMLLPRLQLMQAQLKENTRLIEGILEQLRTSESDEGQKNEHRDVEIILSIPGIGISIAATMLGEASQAIAERDYDALRAHAGVAPVTRRSGKRKFVIRRYACNPRLSNALYHAARVHAQYDPLARALYAELRQRGHSHGRALRTIADRMLRILIAMLHGGSLYDIARLRRVPTGETISEAA